jgi:hypothetical protein
LLKLFGSFAFLDEAVILLSTPEIKKSTFYRLCLGGGRVVSLSCKVYYTPQKKAQCQVLNASEYNQNLKKQGMLSS